MSKCFVSFSSRDGEFVGKLLASLRLQEVDVWDYSNSAQDIPLGESVKAHLKKRIDDSTNVIVVLTEASTDSETGKFTTFEMQYAHQAGKRILPVTVPPFLPRNLPPELAFLADAKYLRFDAADQQTYELSFARLCEEMMISYIPPILGDPRVIFAPRFEREIRGLSIPNEQRILLRTTIDDFTRQYAAEDWAGAKENIRFFIGACSRFLRYVTLYYPTLLLAICEMHDNKLEEAFATLEPLLTHRLADENVWGAIGQIHFLKGEFSRALDAFTLAKEKCPEGKDWEARFNILATCLELGSWVEASAAFKGFDLRTRPLDDQIKIANLQALVFSRQYNWQSVIAVLKDVHDRLIGNAATAIILAGAYEHLRQFEAAVRVLAAEAERLQDNNLYHHLAALHLRLGQLHPASEIYRRHLLNDADRPFQMLTDYALVLRSLDRHEEARHICEHAVALPRPKIDSEFYFRGLAYYLLGRKDHARALFTESKSRERYYEDVVRRSARVASHSPFRTGCVSGLA